ncbi:MAG: TadE/TadG family type IV pilus assembly protein [Candidatus Nanopelagicales bacterium]
MLATRPGRRVTGDSGASAVEFALVVPLLLLVVFGIINFGVLFSQQLTLNNGVREGARRAVVNDPNAPRTCNDIIRSVQNQLSGLALANSAVEVSVSTDGFTSSQPCASGWSSTTFASGGTNLPCKGSYNNGAGGNLVVQARYVSSIPVSFPPFPTSMTLSSKAVYRCEYDA